MPWKRSRGRDGEDEANSVVNTMAKGTLVVYRGGAWRHGSFGDNP
jgi:hypothetical protein